MLILFALTFIFCMLFKVRNKFLYDQLPAVMATPPTITSLVAAISTSTTYGIKYISSPTQAIIALVFGLGAGDSITSTVYSNSSNWEMV